MRDKNQSGFSTIEVIVSLIILSTAMLPLMQVQKNLQQSAIRLEQIETRNAAISNSLKYIRLINPGVEPIGEKDIGNGILYWNAQLASDDAEFLQYFYNDVRRIGLFRVSISIQARGEIIFNREIYQVGWSEAFPSNQSLGIQ